MLWWQQKPRFFSKCKLNVKFIEEGLDTTLKRRRGMQEFIKSCIAYFLKSGQDHAAYERAEWLQCALNLSSCYEFIAKFIGCISDHLQDLTTQRDCPDECKEAVPSLMYAAPRIGDLPNLQNLKTLFDKKFGSSLEPYINEEFVEKLRRAPPTREMKITLLYDIAREFSIEWDGKALKQRLNRQPSLHEERPTLDNTGGGSKGKEKETLSLGIREDFNDELLRYQSSSNEGTSTDTSSQHDEGMASSSSSSSEGNVQIKRPNSYWVIPPPYYLVPKPKKGESNLLKKMTDSEAVPKGESNKDLHELVVEEKRLGNGKSKSGQQSVAIAIYDSGKGKGKAFPCQQPTTSHLPTGTEPTTAMEIWKAHTCAILLYPCMHGGTCPAHVHPNLPEYDDFVAFFKALKKK